MSFSKKFLLDVVDGLLVDSVIEPKNVEDFTKFEFACECYFKVICPLCTEVQLFRDKNVYYESYICCNCGQQSTTELVGFTVVKLFETK